MKQKKKYKLNYKRLLAVILFAYFVFSLVSTILNTPIKNIYIYDNKILSDQEIIDIAKISNYPSFFKTLSSSIAKRLEENPYIEQVKVKKKNFSEVHIYVTEKTILFYNLLNDKTVLENKTEVNGNKADTTLINYVPDTIYDELLINYKNINNDVLKRISEIEYRPSGVDKERFLLSMIDGNYVYVTLDALTDINDYVNIVKTFNGQKGILYLDAGAYFEVME